MGSLEGFALRADERRHNVGALYPSWFDVVRLAPAPARRGGFSF
jgi:hypothetical protein